MDSFGHVANVPHLSLARVGMDCRIALLVFIFGVSGCQLTANNTSPAPPFDPSKSVVAKAKDGPKRKPQPAMLVGLAQVREEQASSLTDSTSQVKMRDEARQLYQEAIKLDPKHLPAYLGLAGVYLRLNDHERAVETCTKALKQFPQDGMLWQQLAMCHNAHKDWDEAIKCLQKALEFEPENMQFAQTLGLTLARAGRIDDSIAVLSKCYGPAHAHFTVARMLHHMDQLEPCKDQLRQALASSPDHQAARDMLAALETPGAGNPGPAAPAQEPGPGEQPAVTLELRPAE